jgi:hypothetical protein
MTEPDRVAEIRQRTEAATPGPWNLDGPWWHGDGSPVHLITAGDERTAVAIEPPHDDKPSDATGNLLFIAHAREDVPWLLDQLARYQAAVQAVENFFLFAEDDRAALGLGIAERGVQAVLAEHLGDER